MSNDLNSLPIGLRERILAANTASEVQALLNSASKYSFMSDKTRRAVSNTAKRRLAELATTKEPSKPAVFQAPKAPAAPQASPDAPRITSRDRRKAARAHMQPVAS